MNDTAHRQERDHSGATAPDRTDVAAYAPISARRAISDLQVLLDIAEHRDPGFSDERLEDLGFVLEGGDPLADQAERLIDARPWGIQATVTFAVVLEPAAPQRSLCLECDVDLLDPDELRRFLGRGGYEVRRVFYRYSWSDPAEVELSGADRQIAERFAARVVSELGS